MKIDYPKMLRKAAFLIAERGHTRNYLVRDGRMCLQGGINCALTGNPTKWVRGAIKARRFVERYLARKEKKPFDSINAITWNNHHSRRGVEVIAALRGGAREAARHSL